MDEHNVGLEETNQEIKVKEIDPRTKIEEGKVSPNKGQKNKAKRNPNKRHEID